MKISLRRRRVPAERGAIFRFTRIVYVLLSNIEYEICLSVTFVPPSVHNNRLNTREFTRGSIAFEDELYCAHVYNNMRVHGYSVYLFTRSTVWRCARVQIYDNVLFNINAIDQQS